MQCEPVIPLMWSPEEEHKGIYRRLLLRRRPGLKARQCLPAIKCRGRGIVVSTTKLATYRKVCGEVRTNSKTVPLLFPHALFGSAHLLMLAHRAFPLGSMGMLHLRNHVVRYRSFGLEDAWEMECHIARQRWVEKGLEFDFDSTVSIGETVVWRSISTFIKRGRPAGEIEPSPYADLFAPITSEVNRSATFTVPADIGRQYARINGDYNPIHVSSLAARLFGFRRAIAHGMWSVARALHDVADIEGPVRLDVAIKGPMFVGSQAQVQLANNHRFDVFCGNNPRPVINGIYWPTDEDDLLL